jgi:hypothetical protein
MIVPMATAEFRDTSDTLEMTETMKNLLAGAASTVIGALIWLAFRWLEGGGDPQSFVAYWQIGYPFMLVAALMLGALFPNGAWRWGPCMIIGQLVVMCSIFDCLSPQLPLGLILHFVMALPLIVASYAGAWLVRRWVRARRQTRAD